MPKLQLERIIDQKFTTIRPSASAASTTAQPPVRPRRFDTGWKLDEGYTFDDDDDSD